jgi:proline racemase
LPGLIGSQFPAQIAFAVAAAGRPGAVDTKIFGDIFLIDLVFDDHAPFAEGLDRDQQDQ